MEEYVNGWNGRMIGWLNGRVDQERVGRPMAIPPLRPLRPDHPKKVVPGVGECRWAIAREQDTASLGLARSLANGVPYKKTIWPLRQHSLTAQAERIWPREKAKGHRRQNFHLTTLFSCLLPLGVHFPTKEAYQLR